jgi:predicted MPP superfamily phosphohydrolase
MRILHFSDTHIRRENDPDFKHFILKPFLADLKEQTLKTKFDIVCLTGDIVDKGAISFDDRAKWHETFRNCLVNPILLELKLTPDNFFFVPGNHDMWRDKDSNIIETGMSQTLKTIEAVNTHIDSNSQEGISRTIPFKTFEKEFYCNFPECKQTMYHSLFKTKVDTDKVGIACFNSAWRSYSEVTDRHNLIIGERQITEAKEFLDDCCVRIAIVHHPIDWLCDFDKKCIESMMETTFQLILSGHLHSGSSWTKTDIYNGVFVSVAPCNWTYGIRDNTLAFSNGYSIIDFDPASFDIRVTHRRYSYKKGHYVANNELGDDSGVSNHKLPSSKEMLSHQYEIGLVTTIKNAHYDELNEHLLTYNTDTKAPKDIKGIFVYPRIVEKIQLKGESKKKDEKESPIPIDNICSDGDNLLLFGVKESGKTLLLDDFLIHYNDNHKKYHRIPILLDFEKITSSRVETLIARYLGISVTCINELLNEHDTVLLVDNLSFGQYDRKHLDMLEAFLNGHKRTRMIACVKQAAEGAIPIELYEYPYFISFRKLHIKAFGSTETRLLIKNWFSAHPEHDIDSKVEKLLDTLLELNLPRTPLAISMFLWILEQQENYEPINNATMLENFVEKLLSKHAKKEIYADQFDFKNKVRMLAEIAYKMFIVDAEDYRMTSRELIDFIDDHLRANKFNFIQAKTVLDHFITQGIFVEEHDGKSECVRFRFSCFMHYFLMRKMEYDPTFLAYVLQPETILMFPEEIELYTGTKRDAVEVLELVVKKMESEFHYVLEKISALPNTFDEIFASQKSLAETMDESFIPRLSAAHKPTIAELDVIRDAELEKVQIEKGIKKKSATMNKKKEMELLWTLAAQVLRNTEETKIEGLKLKTYTSILKCSMAHAFLWKVFIEQFIRENEKNPDFQIDEELKFQRDVLPLIHEMWLRMLLGTTKLSAVIREKIESDAQQTLRISDYERFISVFLYADIRGKDSQDFMKEFIKKVRNPSLVDMTLFKLLAYYFLRSKTKAQDKQYENLIGDLLTSARGLQKTKKGEIIEHFRKKRRNDTSEGNPQ